MMQIQTSRGKWGWWGDPNVTDEMIVDYEMRNKRFETGPFWWWVQVLMNAVGYIPGVRNATNGIAVSSSAFARSNRI
jgi:hypothetical protein